MKKTILVCVALLLMAANQVHAGAIVAGFDSNTLARNDDESTGLVDIGFNVNFFGLTTNQLFVNNNGNVTFDLPLGAFTPFGLTSTNLPIIAPFFADVDTSEAGLEVTYGTGSFNGRDAFGANWVDVDYFSSDSSHTNRNSFQLLLIDRSDIAAGDFDIIFNYDQIQWETGQASGGDDDGLGGDSARVGFSRGTGLPGTFFELAGSGVNGAFLDGGPNALVTNQLNSGMDGRYVFEARNGDVSVQPVPEPSSMAIFAVGAIGMAIRVARQRKTRVAHV